MTMIWILRVTWLMVTIRSFNVNAENMTTYEIRTLTNTTMFMEILGKAVMASDTWTVFANVSILNHDEAEEGLQKMMNAIFRVYDSIEKHTASPSMIKFSNNTLATIKVLRSTIKFIRYLGRKQHGMMHKIRIRRAIEEGGAVLNWLFGTMDADNRREISQQLQSLGAKEDATFHLLHKQISVTKSALEGMKRPLEKLAHESEILSGCIENIVGDIKAINESFTDVTTILQAQTAVNGLLELVTQKAWELKSIIEEELQVIEAVINKQFHHGLVNIDTLQASYREIIKFGGRKFIDLEDSLIGLISTDGRVYDNHLIIKLTIPLPGATRYSIKRMYPIPIIINEVVSAVYMPRSIYTAESEDGNSHVAWSKEETAKCIKVSSGANHGLNVCTYNGPISTGTSNECTKNNSRNSMSQSDNCRKNLIPTPHMWIVKTEQNNKWLFTAGVKQKFNILCAQSNPQAIFLFGSGLLTLKNGCEATSLELKLPFQNHISSTSILEFPEVTEIEAQYDPEWTKNLASENLLNVKTPKSLIGNHDSLTEALQQGISDMDKIEDSWEAENLRSKSISYGLHVRAHSYTLMVILAIMALASAWLFYKFNPISNWGRVLGQANNVRNNWSRQWSRRPKNRENEQSNNATEPSESMELQTIPKPQPRPKVIRDQNEISSTEEMNESAIDVELVEGREQTVQPSRVTKLIDSLNAKRLSFRKSTRNSSVSPDA